MIRLEKIANLGSILILVAVILAIGILRMITPSSEAVRVRNSLIFDVIEVQEIEWTPTHYPLSFKLEELSPPLLFREVVGRIKGPDTALSRDFSSAVAIGTHLAVGEIKGGPVQSDTVSTFKTIMSEGTGYCADFTQVFNGLAHAAALPVREWGMSFDGFGGRGHAFNEVFDRDREQWVFIDTFYSFYVVDRVSALPMSAMEFRSRLRDRDLWSSIQVVPISDVRFGFKSETDALEYYYEGVNEFYLWWGNNVFQYDSAGLVSIAGKISRSAEQAVAILTGVHPQIRIPRLPENSAAIDSLGMVRTKFVGMMFIEIIVLGMLLLRFSRGLYRQFKRRSSKRSSRARS